MARSRKRKKSRAYTNLNLFIDGMKYIQRDKLHSTVKSKRSEFLFVSSALVDSFNSNCTKQTIKSFMLDMYPIIVDIIGSAKKIKDSRYSISEKYSILEDSKAQIKSPSSSIEIKRVKRSWNSGVYPVCLTVKHSDIPQTIIMSCFLNETTEHGPSYGVFLDTLNAYRCINIKDLEFNLIEESLLNPIL